MSPVGDVERHAEHGLELGFVPARERAPAVGRLHLGGGDDLLHAVVVDVGAAVEAAQLVVEDAGELDGERRSCPPRSVPAGVTIMPVGRLVERPRRVGAVDGAAGDRQLGRVEHELMACRVRCRAGSRPCRRRSRRRATDASRRSYRVGRATVGRRYGSSESTVGGARGQTWRDGTGGSVSARVRYAVHRPAIMPAIMNGRAPARFDVTGIGNALVDVIASSTEEFLVEHGLVKGSMTLVEIDRAAELYGALGTAVEMSGGSAANTVVRPRQFRWACRVHRQGRHRRPRRGVRPRHARRRRHVPWRRHRPRHADRAAASSSSPPTPNAR